MKKETIAAFDFDNTLTDRDSLLPFICFVKGRINFFLGLVQLLPAFIRFLIKLSSRQQVKEAILTHFFKGYSFEELERLATLYAQTRLKTFIVPKALNKLREHLRMGHRCILISASIDLYLTPWALTEGIECVLASRLEVDASNQMTGLLKGRNCWGEEKVRRLIESIGPRDTFILYAYGDSEGDAALLKTADFPFYKNF